MQLSVLQILALKHIRGCGNIGILKLQRFATERTKQPEIELDNPESSDEQSSLCHLLHRYHQEFGIQTIRCTNDHLAEAFKKARQTLEQSSQRGIYAIGINDELYPKNLKISTFISGRRGIPVVMWYKGNLSVLSRHKTAVIGSRHISETGYSRGENTGKNLASLGITVVSGLARGCDTSGHCGALKVGGATVALLGHGLDSVYPPENAGLAQEIVSSGGLLMSEYPIGTAISRRGLIERSCLQALLADDVVVVECGEKSGTFYAANGALSLGKKLYVLSYSERQGGERAGNTILSRKGAIWVNEDVDWRFLLREREQIQKRM